MDHVSIVPAHEKDVPVILEMIRGLAEYEQLSHQVVATEESLRTSLFGARPAAEVVLAYSDRTPVGFALYFHNYSTFLGRSGLYLEDLFVVPAWRGRGVGRKLLSHLASIAVARACGRMEWAVLDWNESAIGFYQRLGARVLDDWRICRLSGEALSRAAGDA
ncbi:MAG TPA: GNAT family N-acetyltransferase [Vicinamibacterales bacterium]|nr:GNAT family N-acetyltransferase [Vicinamibacterales bacterium]